LRRHGADARIYSLVSESGLPYVYRIRPTALEDETREAHVWQKVIDLAIRPARQMPGYQAAEMFSLPASVVDFRKVGKVFEQSDVVHLHWVVGMFDYEHAGDVLADKPMTWTLADMNAFTGGCHYSEGCEEFKRECRNCPLLGGDNDLAHRAWQIKKAAYDQLKHLHIICPSKWMADLARSSSLFGDKPVHYIPNAFPVDRFSPTNKTVARLALGLPTDKKLLIFGAESLTQVRKGGDKLKAALEHLKQAGHLENVEIITFGKNTIELPVPVHGLGHIADESYLAQAYSAADGFLFPSLEDNAPLTVGESLLCGTPVVTFPVGNVPDLVQHAETGYIARYLDIDDFAKGIEWILNADSKAALQRSVTCRIRAARFHDPALAVQRHMAVYAAAMSRE
jgi:glycosyltransferase involved in cell wall biosynthesis